MPSGNMVDGYLDGAVGAPLDGALDGHAGPGATGPDLALRGRVAELEQEVAQLKAALHARQQLGFVTGLVAERIGLAPEEAWALLVHISQHLNVKVREVGRVITAGHCGQLTPEDAALVERLNAYSPDGTRLV